MSLLAVPHKLEPDSRLLCSGFLNSVEKYPERPALECEGRVITYRELYSQAASLSATLTSAIPGSATKLTAVLGDRSDVTYAGILGALLSGHGYVPLSTNFPASQIRHMLATTGCQSIIVEESAIGVLELCLDGLDSSLFVVLPECDHIAELAEKWPSHQFIGREKLASSQDFILCEGSQEGIAYVMFTSGSTGRPKGVPITHSNIQSHLDFSQARYQFSANDRFSQMFPLTFDLSVFDLFAAWGSGACVCYPSRDQTLSPGNYVVDARLTIWYANPSMLLYMHSIGALEKNCFPLLRLSLFCGEALPVNLIEKWADAAPQSIVENLYGPTELTLTCSYYRWRDGASEDAHNGIVPIGYPHPSMSMSIVDGQLREVGEGMEGELVMAGPQMSPGYIKNDEKTRAAFVQIPGKCEKYYRTGDLVKRIDPNGPLLYLGRMDNQVQIHGVRVEPGEIEEAIRRVAGVEVAIVLGWPKTDRGAEGLVGFIDNASLDSKTIRKRLRAELPTYLIPNKINVIERFPLNSNGKIDRIALERTLDCEK